MNKMLICLVLLFACINISSARDNELQNIKDSLILQTQKIEKLESDIKEVRRDQLNYSIEKNLLKETFNTNYSTINLILTIILITLSIFGGIFGYIGFKNISELKKDYSSELTTLKNLRTSFSKRLNALVSREKEFNQKMQEIISTNENQNAKIRLLELKEKITVQLKQNNYNRALDYINIGLSEFINDYELMIYKAMCLSNLDNYRDYIQTIKRLMVLAKGKEPEHLKTFTQNLAEFSLFNKDIPLFESTFSRLDMFDNKTLCAYLIALKYYVQNDKANLITHIRTFIGPIEKANLIHNWDYRDALRFINKYDFENKVIFQKFMFFLMNKISKQELNDVLNN